MRAEIESVLADLSCDAVAARFLRRFEYLTGPPALTSKVACSQTRRTGPENRERRRSWHRRHAILLSAQTRRHHPSKPRGQLVPCQLAVYPTGARCSHRARSLRIAEQIPQRTL